MARCFSPSAGRAAEGHCSRVCRKLRRACASSGKHQLLRRPRTAEARSARRWNLRLAGASSHPNPFSRAAAKLLFMPSRNPGSCFSATPAPLVSLSHRSLSAPIVVRALGLSQGATIDYLSPHSLCLKFVSIDDDAWGLPNRAPSTLRPQRLRRLPPPLRPHGALQPVSTPVPPIPGRMLTHRVQKRIP